MKSSLPCRLILNWPDPFIAAGILKKTHTNSSKKQPLNDLIDNFALAKRRNIHIENNLSKSECSSLFVVYSNHIQLTGTFHVLKGIINCNF